MLQFLSQLGKSLAVSPSTLAQRLSDNALGDPNSGVRWRNLRRVSLADQQQPLVGALDLADVSVTVRAGELSLVDDVNESGKVADELRERNIQKNDVP